MSDISSEVQKEVARIREIIATTKALLPGNKANFVFYEVVISTAEKAVSEQDAAVLCQILPMLREME